MSDAFVLSDAGRLTAGVLLLSIVTIEWGGTYLLALVRGRQPATPFQQMFARAGHAHAGVLVTLGLVCVLLTDAAGLTGWTATLARTGVPAAAILMSAGFFLSSMGRERTAPNRLIALLWLGAAALGVGVVALGLGLLRG